MKRRGFLGALLGVPAVVKAMGVETQSVERVILTDNSGDYAYGLEGHEEKMTICMVSCSTVGRGREAW